MKVVRQQRLRRLVDESETDDGIPLPCSMYNHESLTPRAASTHRTAPPHNLNVNVYPTLPTPSPFPENDATVNIKQNQKKHQLPGSSSQCGKQPNLRVVQPCQRQLPASPTLAHEARKRHKKLHEIFPFLSARALLRTHSPTPLPQPTAVLESRHLPCPNTYKTLLPSSRCCSGRRFLRVSSRPCRPLLLTMTGLTLTGWMDEREVKCHPSHPTCV
ncbi:hypothetical protein IWZ03DRAFT_197639 [Phyllosticta citriasiana]|uniref:Uncharacterized protein n=1 Tax=Phyllosticta citriasiana TaxID=595635 RepID=A0ABR1KL24_9PEZI